MKAGIQMVHRAGARYFVIVGSRLRRESVDLTKLTCGSRTAVGVLSLACPRESTQREGHPGRCAGPSILFLRGAGTLRSSPTPSARCYLLRAGEFVSRSVAV